MAVQTTQTFACDANNCSNTSTDEGEMAWVSVSYRLIDGSSGVEDKHFCGTHEKKVIPTLRTAGVMAAQQAARPASPGDPVGPPEQTARKRTTKKTTAKKTAKKTTRSR